MVPKIVLENRLLLPVLAHLKGMALGLSGKLKRMKENNLGEMGAVAL